MLGWIAAHGAQAVSRTRVVGDIGRRLGWLFVARASREFSDRAQFPAYRKACSMIYERWRWYFFALACSIVLAIAVAYLVERRCQKELAFQRAYPEALSELIVGSQPVKCWLEN